MTRTTEAQRLRNVAHVRAILKYLENPEPLTDQQRHDLAEALARPRERRQGDLLDGGRRGC